MKTMESTERVPLRGENTQSPNSACETDQNHQSPPTPTTAKAWNALYPPGTLVCYYPRRKSDGSFDPASRRKATTTTTARRISATSFTINLEGQRYSVSLQSLTICQRYWIRIERPGRVNHWSIEPVELDDLERAELIAREESHGNTVRFSQTPPDRYEEMVKECLR